MSEWELRVSQREIHRMHVVRLTIEGRETVGRGAKTFGDLSTSDEAATAQDERARGRGAVAWQSRQSSVEQNGLREDRESA